MRPFAALPMVKIPDELARAIQSQDCVLWVGAGFGALAGRPNWEELLRRLVPTCPESARAALGDLLEQGRLRTVLTYVHRHFGDDPLADLLEKVSAESADSKPQDGAQKLAALPWRACFATTYADLVQRIFTGSAGAASKPAVLNHVDVHHLSLREHESFFILRTPPTGRAMRADGVVFDLVEEVVRTRHILFLGFEPDDPDLVQVLDLLDRIGRGNRHYAILPWVSAPEAEELADRFAIEVIPTESSTQLVDIFGALERACAEVSVRPSDAPAKLAALDLARAVRNVELRADLAVDEALGLDVESLEHLIDALPGGSVAGLSTTTLLRTGSAMLAHRRVAQARRCFQQVITHGAGREFSNLARFNLALTALVEGDRAAALDGLATCAEVDRSLAIVPPRMELREVVGHTGTHIVLVCRDRESKADLEIAVATLARPVAVGEEERFHAGVAKLAAIDHPAIKGVHGGFADGRLFGLLREPTPGIVLADALEPRPMPLAKVVEVATPILEGLAACHARGLLHRNINPAQILVGKSGAVLRGFGFPPVIGFARPSVRLANLGYMAPELSTGSDATAASDVFSMTAVLYRMLSGQTPAGAVPQLSSLVPQADPRLDDLLHAGLHPEPSKRPSLGQLREQLADILATPEIGRAKQDSADAGVPRAIVDRKTGSLPTGAGVPEQVEETVSAPGTKILLPEDPNDLEAWAWILERKPTHAEAREAVARIEAEARASGSWDRVAEALKVRAQHTQVVRERAEILGELVQIYEQRLAAPASAFEALQTLIDASAPGEQVAAVGELTRLAEITGQWTQLAESLVVVAERTTDTEQQADLHEQLGVVLSERLGASERAVAAYEKAVEVRPRASTYGALVPLYRKLGRDAELAQALLSLADLRTGAERHRTLISAAKVLRESLGEEEAAFDVVSLVLTEDPDEADANVMGESLARALDRKPALVDLLARRAQSSLGDAEAVDALREAAQLAEELGQRERAIELWQALASRSPGDRQATEKTIAGLRTAVPADPSRRPALIDALAGYVDIVGGAQEKAALLLEAAALLDEEDDGKERAADSRERVIELVSIEKPAAKEAAAALERWYKRQEDHAALARLLERQGKAMDLDDAARVDAWKKLFALRKGPLADESGGIEALEQLSTLQPEETRWRDELLERYLAMDDFKRAGPLIRAQVNAEKDPKRKAELLLRGGLLRQEIGKIDAAIEAFEEAVALDPSLTGAWLGLRDLYRQNEQPLKAIEAQVAGARSLANRTEKSKLLFDAGKKYIDELDKPDRGLALLEDVVAADPDHREATGILLERLVAQGDLSRAWPHAQTYVMQVRAQAANDHALNLRALSLAGRCALAVDDKERAREYLEKARVLDATNLDVLRLLAELDMDAGRFADALRSYQSVVLGVGDKLAPGELSRLYVRMAEARVGMNERPKAVQMLERALDIDADNEEAIDRMISLGAEVGGAAAVVKAKRRLADTLARREQNHDDAAQAAALRSRRIELLQEISRLQVEELKLIEEGVRTLEEVLALTPDDPAVLHKILDVFTTGERWRDATNVLSRLAEAQKNAKIRAKYQYAGALIFRDHLDDETHAREWLQRTMESDPTHDRAWTVLVDLLEKQRAWQDLSRAIRQKLKSLPEGTPPATTLDLFTRLGDVYEQLGDGKTALAAHHQAARLAASAGESDDAQRKRHEKALKMAIALGDDQLDKAVTHGHALIAAAPTEFETYHRLVELYLKMGKKDRARAVARTLRFLKQADEAELELAEQGQIGAQARGTISRDLWRASLYHASEDPRLSDLFALVWPMVAAREGRTLAHHRVRRDARTEVTLQSPTAMARYLAHACQVLDAPVPDFYPREDELGSITVDALADGDGANRTVYPSLLVGRDALHDVSEGGLKFRCGRAIAKAKPEHILSAVLPSSTSLRNAVWGAVAVTHGDAAVPDDCRTEARRYGELLEKFLQASRLEQLKVLAARVVSGGEVDTRSWVQGVNYTITRAGFVLADNLEVAAQILTREGDDGTPIPVKERVRDLIAYSVSEPYMRLRKELFASR